MNLGKGGEIQHSVTIRLSTVLLLLLVTGILEKDIETATVGVTFEIRNAINTDTHTVSGFDRVACPWLLEAI